MNQNKVFLNDGEVQIEMDEKFEMLYMNMYVKESM